MKRKYPFINNSVYHVFNRGVDKRNIFNNVNDLDRFILSIREFNSTEPLGSIHELLYGKIKRLTNEEKFGHPVSKLVDIVAYNLLPNHFHFILMQKVDNGISEFMRKLQMGYSKHFNSENNRSGSLFQGPFKAKIIEDNTYLRHLSAYVNLNHLLHDFSEHHGDEPLLKVVSSIDQYINETSGEIEINPEVILKQFKNGKDYEKFALNALRVIKKNKQNIKELERGNIPLIFN